MTPRTFYTQFSLVSLVVALIFIVLHSTTTIIQHQIFSWITWIFFVVFCIVLFYLSSLSLKSPNKNLFGQVFLFSIFFKMLFSVLIIISYVLITKTKDMYFIFPFLIAYSFFTVYEVYFITKLSTPNV